MCDFSRYYFKLLAIKDEYEVARLYSDGTFLKSVAEKFEGTYKIRFHLAPPLIARRDPQSGELIKRADIALYQAMSTSFFCMAAMDGVEFPKALGISASTYAQALKGRHDGKVSMLDNKTLSDTEIFAAAEQQVLLRAMQACPKAIPSDVQVKVKDAIKKMSKK